MFSPGRKLCAVTRSLQKPVHNFAQVALSGVSDRAYCVLGVDPAVAGATGYGVVETDGRKCRMLRFGALRPAPGVSGPLGKHLRDIHALIASLIEEYRPHSVAVESVFTALNMKTALRLAEVRGVVLLAAAQAVIPCFSYSPREVKASVAGYGNAEKSQVQQMVRVLLGLSETPEPADASDALAVALCHLHVAEAKARLESGKARARLTDAPSVSRRRNREPLPRILAPR